MTTPNPPSQYAHLGELLTLMREEMRKGFDDLRREIGGRVSSDVYESDKRLTEERLSRLGAEVAEIRADADRAEARREAEKLAQADEKREETNRRAADRRMIWGALIGAGCSLIIGLALAALQLLTT